ncbi:isocitrate lyase/phosphoenolpyruvate mutase family protein [Roseospira goensis]|uniref:2-methylisocitrate lyase-like PEP mutase family enzyme n=1 Tax=Roseospira goensis TaxID=391922 RepID=A0A7W6S066_9PROT|nr:isocitrate lyase/phosphoenolpyruvate mutase family protein [Roseospira goensis]MBB4286448.1 2-methylisocitrate lyase-like PEP mutase family enzyme [Roseospira goensis]
MTPILADTLFAAARVGRHVPGSDLADHRDRARRRAIEAAAPARGPLPAQARRMARFRALHTGSRGLLLPAAWDAGSAALLRSLGFQALAASPGGFPVAAATTATRFDLTRDQALFQARDVVEGADLPVTADIATGRGASPADWGRAVRRAFDLGLCGVTVSDDSGRAGRPLLSLRHMSDGMAAVRAARPARDFLVTARTETLLHGGDLDEAIRRVSAYATAGADVVAIAGLTTLDQVRTVRATVATPLAVMLGPEGTPADVPALIQAGVHRIEVGAALARAALGGFVGAARALCPPAAPQGSPR